ncbi:MAG TPA: fatty acid desaturase [Polyangiales bacterium]
MKLSDPRVAPEPWYGSWVAPQLNDPRDAVFVGLIVQCLAMAACGIALFFVGPVIKWIAPLYWVALIAITMDRFTLMLHCTSHRQLFKPKYRALNLLIPWVIGPFFGQTPNTYFAHHMGMHHLEENLAGDLSSTMRFQRDRFWHWLQYWGRFLSRGLFDLTRYMARVRRTKLMQRVLIGELGYWALFALMFWKWPAPTFVVFGAPLLIIRTLMMAGNWAQHAFIAHDRPSNPYAASITCINSRYNRRCFNDGYHIGHHLKARAHYTEYPVEFEQNLARYAEEDAIVFEGIDFFIVWVYLMTGSWSRLARAYVPLPGAPVRNESEIIAFLKDRVRAFPSVREDEVVIADHRDGTLSSFS